jgi:hypothetical protein
MSELNIEKTRKRKRTPNVKITPSELYNKFFANQDQLLLNEKLYEFPLKESEYTKKENTHILTNYSPRQTIRHPPNLRQLVDDEKCNIDIDCDQDRYHFINNLHLRIYNPEKKPLRDIIKSMYLDIGGSKISELCDLETMLSNYTHLNLVEPTVQVDNFLHVYLPFVNKQTLMYCQGGNHNIRFVLTFAGPKPQFRLYGDAYTLKNNTLIKIVKRPGCQNGMQLTPPSYNKIFQPPIGDNQPLGYGSPTWENILFMSQYIDYYFNRTDMSRKTNLGSLHSPIHCIFINLFQEIDGKKIKSKGNVKNVRLVLDNETVFDGIPEKTGESEYIINFSNEFYKPHTSTVNFSMVQDASITVTTDSFGVQLDEFHAVSSNILIYMDGMFGLRFG